MPKLLELTKSFLNLNNSPVKKLPLKSDGFYKVKFKKLERCAEDKIRISFVGFHRNILIHGDVMI